MGKKSSLLFKIHILKRYVFSKCPLQITKLAEHFHILWISQNFKKPVDDISGGLIQIHFLKGWGHYLMLINFFHGTLKEKQRNAYPFNSTKLHILTSSPCNYDSQWLRGPIQKILHWKRQERERERGRQRERERTLVVDKSLTLFFILFILSVSSMGLDTMEQDCKKLSSLYIPYVAGVLFSFLFVCFLGWFFVCFLGFFLVSNSLMASP